MGDEVDWLIRLIVVRLDGGDVGVEGLVLAFGGVEGVLQLAEGGQKAGAVSAHGAVFFSAKPELDREPIHLKMRRCVRG